MDFSTSLWVGTIAIVILVLGTIAVVIHINKQEKKLRESTLEALGTFFSAVTIGGILLISFVVLVHQKRPPTGKIADQSATQIGVGTVIQIETNQMANFVTIGKVSLSLAEAKTENTTANHSREIVVLMAPNTKIGQKVSVKLLNVRFYDLRIEGSNPYASYYLAEEIPETSRK